jgi:hypothetical protein
MSETKEMPFDLTKLGRIGNWAVGLAAIVLTTAAQALSVHGFFNDVSLHAQPWALILALRTEAFRNQQAGHASLVACMAEELIPTDTKQVTGFDRLVVNLGNSTNQARESAESYILGSIEGFCHLKDIEHPSQASTFEPMPVRTFFAKLPNGADKFDVLSLALSTQALRAFNVGDDDRGHCIMLKLVGTTINGERNLPTGLQELAKDLGQTLRASPTEAVEGKVMEAIISNCGVERATSKP